MSSKSLRKKQQLNNDQINFDEYLLELKRVLFKLFAFYDKRISVLPRPLIYALTFVEFLQALFFIVNPQLQMYAGEGPIVQVFSSTLGYLTGFTFIYNSQGQSNFFLLLCTFLWLLFSLFLVYFSYLKIAKPNALDIHQNHSQKQISTSKLQNFLINLCIAHLILLNSILAIPYFSVILPAFYCTKYTFVTYSITNIRQCYDLSHIISIALALFSVLIVFSLKAACIVLIFERNPLKKSIYACHSNISIFFKTGCHILSVVYLMIDPQLMFKPLYIGGLVLVYGWYLFMFRWQQVGFYDKPYMNFMLCLQILLVCFAANNLIQYFFNGSSNMGISFVEFVLASCILAFSAMSVVNVTKKKMPKQFYCNPEAMKKSQQAQNFIIELIYHLITEPNQNLRQNNIRVFLKQLDRSMGSRLMLDEPQFVKEVNQYLRSKEPSNEKNVKKIIYQYFRILLEDIIDIKGSFMLQALRCAFLFEHGLKTKALCQIYKIESGKLEWMEEFFVFEIKQRNCTAASDSEDDSSQEAFTEIDEQKIIIYDHYVSLMSTIEQAIVDSILANKEFWSQILQEHPDFEYAKKLTSRLSENHKQIVKIHKKITSIFSNSLKEKFLFFSYLELLQWSKDHTQEMIQFLEQNQEHTVDKDSKKAILEDMNAEKYSLEFEENEKIVMIELDFTEGIIKNCNSQIMGFLGYTRNELIGRKIDKLLPGMIALKHSRLVQNFINRRDSISKSSERIVYAVHKDRFIVPGFLTIKVISSEQKGLKLVSYIRPLSHEPRQFGLLTSGNDTIILGVSREITLKIKDEEFIEDIKNESVYLELLFPKLKVERMVANEFCEAEMSTLNSIECDFQGESNTKVFIKYQDKHYQEGLHLRYYKVRMANKLGKYLKGTLAALDMSFTQLPSQAANTSRLIQNFHLKKQQQRIHKMEQLCRFKKNYLSKYNHVKYFMCFLVFMAMITAGIWENLYILSVCEKFGDQIEQNRLKLENIDFIARDLSQLQSQWLGVGLDDSSGGENQQKKSRDSYSSIVDRYNQNLQKFRENTESNALESIFNIQILPQKPQRFKSLIIVQTQSQQINQIQSEVIQSDSDKAIYKIQRNSILANTRQLLKFYIDEELTKYIEASSKFEKVEQIKFIFGICSVSIVALFSVTLFIVVKKIRVHLDKNLQIIGLLTYSEIHFVVTSFADYLKLSLSSQLDSIDQFDTIQKIIVSDSKVVNLNGINSDHDNNKISHPQKSIKPHHKKSFQSQDRNDDFNDQSSLHFKFNNNNKKIDLSSKLIQPLDIHDTRRSNQGNVHSKGKIGGMKKSIKRIRESDNYSNYKRKDEINLNQVMASRVTPRAAVLKNELLNIKKEKQSKKKISFVNESQFTGMELSMQALETNQPEEQSHTQIMYSNNIKIGDPHDSNETTNIIRKDRKRLKTRSTAPIQMPYPSQYNTIIVCLIMVAAFGGISYMMFRIEQGQGRILVGYEQSINNLIKISGKMMFLRSFIRPYFSGLTDQNKIAIMEKDTLSQQIQKLQEYTTVSFPTLQNIQLILKNIYRDISKYLYLLETFNPSPDYYLSPETIPKGLSQGIDRIQVNFLALHEQIKVEIMRIDGLSREEEKNLKVKYTIETVCSIMMLVSIMAVEYYLVVWRLKVDEKASFKMIEFFPLRVISANKSVYKAIKKETSKVET